MRIEALCFKRKDKTEVKIYIGLRDNYSRSAEWVLEDVYYRPYRKREFRSLWRELSDDYQYRHMSYEEKGEAKRRELINFVGIDKVKEAFLAAWEQIKPNVEDLLDIQKEPV